MRAGDDQQRSLCRDLFLGGEEELFDLVVFVFQRLFRRRVPLIVLPLLGAGFSMSRQKVNVLFAHFGELDDGVGDSLFGDLCDVRGLFAVDDMEGVDLLDLELPGHLGVAVRVDGIKFDPGRMVRVALDQVCNPGIFAPLKKTINQKILLELSQHLARLC